MASNLQEDDVIVQTSAISNFASEQQPVLHDQCSLGEASQGHTEAVGLAELIAMGFLPMQASQALNDANGDVERAADFLCTKTEKHQSHPWLAEVEIQARLLSCNIKEQFQTMQGQLHKTKDYIEERRCQAREWLSGDDAESIEQFKVALELVKARLLQLKELAQAVSKKLQGRDRDAAEEERLLRVEKQISEAEQFVVETLACLHAQGASTFKTLKGKYFDKEALSAVATTAVDAADAAIAAVERIACDGSVSTGEDKQADAEVVESSNLNTVVDRCCEEMPMETEAVVTVESEAEEICLDPPSSTSPDEVVDRVSCNPGRGEPYAGATSLDHAQVLISQSLAAFRSRASWLISSSPRDSPLATSSAL
jgi:hypothetical protein